LLVALAVDSPELLAVALAPLFGSAGPVETATATDRLVRLVEAAGTDESAFAVVPTKPTPTPTSVAYDVAAVGNIRTAAVQAAYT